MRHYKNNVNLPLCFTYYVQVTERLKDKFQSDPENRVLDSTATIELNADPFPYELVFNWVNGLNYCLINLIDINSCETKSMHALLGKRLSNYCDQYKSSICLSNPV